MFAGFLNIDALSREYFYVFLTLLLISSIVIADPNSQLNLPDNFERLSVDEIFMRGDKQNTVEENEWRNTKKDPDESNVRWGAKSIYEDQKDIDPFFSSDNSNDFRDVPEATRQIQIKF